MVRPFLLESRKQKRASKKEDGNNRQTLQRNDENRMPLLQHNLLAKRARMPELQSQHQKDTFPRNARIDLQEQEIHFLEQQCSL